MTRPLAAGGFFVALVPEEPFLGKYNFYGNPFDLGKLGFSLLNPQVNKVPGSAVGIPRGGGRRKPHPESTRKTKVKSLAVKDGEAHRK
jgi:hypothetical protein